MIAALLLIITGISEPTPEREFLWCVGRTAPGHAPKDGKCDDGTVLMECPDEQPIPDQLVNCKPPASPPVS